MPSVNRTPTMSIAERRTRLARRHHLAAEAAATDATTAARSLIGLHATDPATIFLSARARVPGLTTADVEAALYDELTLVKHLCMRRTMFVVPDDLLAVVHVACTGAIAARLRKRLADDVEQGGIARDGGRWVRDAERTTLAALAEGDATGAQLSRRIPELQAKLVYAEGKSWGGTIGVAGRVFSLLAADGRIRRGRPSGSWTSSQHKWTLAPESDRDRPTVAVARAELVRRWLSAFGPATLGDVTWWTGLGVGLVRTALAAIDVVDVDLEGEADPGIALADDLVPERPVEPWVALLPSLDPTTMGWKRREWYVGEHAPMLFDRNGNAGPTVWSDARIVGGWSQRPTGEVVVQLLEDVGSNVAAAIASRPRRCRPGSATRWSRHDSPPRSIGPFAHRWPRNRPERPPTRTSCPWRSERERYDEHVAEHLAGRRAAARRHRSTREGVNFAVFSEIAERIELCLFDARGDETRSDAARGHGVRAPRLRPRHRSRPALRVPGARAVGAAPGTAVQPGEAAARSVRDGCHGRARLGRRGVRPHPVEPRSNQPPRQRASHAAGGGHRPGVRLGRRPEPADPAPPDDHLRDPRPRADDDASRRAPGAPGHVRRPRVTTDPRLPRRSRGHVDRVVAGAPVRVRALPPPARAAQLLGLQLDRLPRPARALLVGRRLR